MTTPAWIRTAALSALFCGVSHAALAQTITTAAPAPSGISQEQALSLAARLDALERRNAQLEAQVADLKAQVSAGQTVIRQEVHAQPTVSLAGGRPAFATPDGNFKIALRSVVQFDAAHY